MYFNKLIHPHKIENGYKKRSRIYPKPRTTSSHDHYSQSPKKHHGKEWLHIPMWHTGDDLLLPIEHYDESNRSARQAMQVPA